MLLKSTKTPTRKKSFRIHPIHRRIALHASSLLFVLGGGFIPLIHFGDQTLDVTAKVAAPLPSAPATITSLSDQQRVTTSTVTVTGTCPDQTYVVLYRDNIAIGVAQCQNGKFSIVATLSPGANTLFARVFNFTDDEGPRSPPITVFYDVPSAQPQPSAGESGAGQLTINIPYTYKVQYPGDTWSWEVTLAGGVKPYDITIDWGDGQTEHFTRGNLAAFTIAHEYQKVGTYNPLIRVTDASGAAATFQLVAEIKDRLSIGIVPQIFSSLANNSQLGPMLAWPVYGLVTLSVVGFWGYEALALHKHLSLFHKLKRRA